MLSLFVSRQVSQRILSKSQSVCCPLRQVTSAAYSTSTDPDLLHRSKLPTYHFQASLPRLPIPEFSKTCERYLQAQRPLLSDEELKKTEAIVNRFRDGEGKAMHEELVALDKKNSHTSYISAPWSDMYLKDRRAVALNHNPFMAMNDDPRPEYNNRLVRATNLLMSSLRFMKTLRSAVLDPEVYHMNAAKSDTDSYRKTLRWFPKSLSWYGSYLIYKAFPLDMSQFPWLFNTNRIPRWEKDELTTDPSAKHMLVMRNGHMYTFDCLDDSGRIKPAREIMGYLAQIINDPSTPAEHPVGIFTTQPRDDWTAAREKLVAAGNEELLKKIDGAYFALVLDDAKPSDPVKLSRSFLHSDGTNRWFDKCFSLIMDGSGQTCVNFEHSWGDGVAVLRYFNEVFKDSTERPLVHPDTEPLVTDPSAVNKLDFMLTEELKNEIDNAKQKFKTTVKDLDLDYVHFRKFGKNFIKSQKLSPDSYMQLAIQIAFYRLYGKSAATYESCSTSAYRHGRTETVRSCTVETHTASELFSKTSGTRPSVAEMRASIEACTPVHNDLTKNAAMGQGFDRHLFALKYYEAQKGNVPEIFKDPNYTSLNHIILSTSTLTSPALQIGGFAPVVPDGFGIGYGIQDEELGFILTAYPPNRSISDFLSTVQQTITDMHSVLEGHDFQ